jgi:hypothetical protein
MTTRNEFANIDVLPDLSGHLKEFIQPPTLNGVTAISMSSNTRQLISFLVFFVLFSSFFFFLKILL